MGLTDFSALERNTFDQYRNGLPMWGEERPDSTQSGRSRDQRAPANPHMARHLRASESTGQLGCSLSEDCFSSQ